MHNTRISFILLVFLGFLTSFVPAHAEIKISNITGESIKKNFISEGDNSSLRVFGGFAGDESAGGCATKNFVSSCDNCVANGSTFKSCNQRRAYKDLRLQITFSSTSIAPGSSTAAFTPTIEPAFSGTGQPPIMSYNKTPSQVTGPNQPATVSVTWSQLCQAVEDQEDNLDDQDQIDCKIDATQVFNVGFDSNGDGKLDGDGDDFTTVNISIAATDAAEFDTKTDGTNPCVGGLCQFTLKPGDEKAIVENVQFESVKGTSLNIENVLLYCDPTTDFAEVTQSPPTVRLPFVSPGITENKVTGFTNGTTYSCHAAIEDEAGNIGLFFLRGTNSCPTASDTACRQVTPDDVIGLFSKDTNCFIATAAYGSPMESHVQMLREFRNKFLAPSYVGRALVKMYYAVSPPLARWIAQDPARRSAARALLTPVVWSVSVFMNWSWTLGLAVLFGCGLLTFRRKFL